MQNRHRWQYLLLLLTLLSVCLADSPEICKCTCFTNSTLIPLNGKSSSSKGEKVKPRSCAVCNRQFCLDYHLPICKGATETDVFATCFQRDSVKDQLVVYIFILVTASLLIWAAAKPWYDRWQMGKQPRQTYSAVNNDDDGLR